MVSPPGDFFFYFFNALLIYFFSYDIHLDHLNNDDDGHNDYTPSSTPTPPTLQRSPTTQTAMATAAGAGMFLFYCTNVFLGYSTYCLG